MTKTLGVKRRFLPLNNNSISNCSNSNTNINDTNSNVQTTNSNNTNSSQATIREPEKSSPHHLTSVASIQANASKEYINEVLIRIESEVKVAQNQVQAHNREIESRTKKNQQEKNQSGTEKIKRNKNTQRSEIEKSENINKTKNQQELEQHSTSGRRKTERTFSSSPSSISLPSSHTCLPLPTLFHPLDARVTSPPASVPTVVRSLRESTLVDTRAMASMLQQQQWKKEELAFNRQLDLEAEKKFADDAKRKIELKEKLQEKKRQEQEQFQLEEERKLKLKEEEKVRRTEDKKRKEEEKEKKRQKQLRLEEEERKLKQKEELEARRRESKKREEEERKLKQKEELEAKRRESKKRKEEERIQAQAEAKAKLEQENNNNHKINNAVIDLSGLKMKTLNLSKSHSKLTATKNQGKKRKRKRQVLSADPSERQSYSDSSTTSSSTSSSSSSSSESRNSDLEDNKRKRSKRGTKKKKNEISTPVPLDSSVQPTPSVFFICPYPDCGRPFKHRSNWWTHKKNVHGAPRQRKMRKKKSDKEAQNEEMKEEDKDKEDPTTKDKYRKIKDENSNNREGPAKNKKFRRRKRRNRNDDDSGEEDFDDDFNPFIHSNHNHMITENRLTNRSLRRAKPVNYRPQIEENPHSFIELTWYESESVQPFKVEIDRSVNVLLDIHSHLTDTEVIGMLAGEYRAKDKTLVIMAAFPCKTQDTTDNRFNVEMDYASQAEAGQRINDLGMRVVGWYHSHPYFRNLPSMIDVENQEKYQSMFMESKDSEDSYCPFVGAIITPYGSREFRPLPSDIKWFFNADQSSVKRNPNSIATDLGQLPMELWTNIVEVDTNIKKDQQKLRGKEKLDKVLSIGIQLCNDYSEVNDRVSFDSQWLPADDVVEQDDSKKKGEEKEKKKEKEAEKKSSAKQRGGEVVGQTVISPLRSTSIKPSNPVSPSSSSNHTSMGYSIPFPPASIQNKLSAFHYSLYHHLPTYLSHQEKEDRVKLVLSVLRKWHKNRSSNHQSKNKEEEEEEKEEEIGKDDDEKDEKNKIVLTEKVDKKATNGSRLMNKRSEPSKLSTITTAGTAFSLPVSSINSINIDNDQDVNVAETDEEEG